MQGNCQLDMLAPASAFRRAKPLLGTLVEVACQAVNTDVALHASEQAFYAVAQVQRLMSRHDCASELSSINGLKPGVWFTISKPTLEVLQFAQTLSQRTGGVFDVVSTSTCAPAGSSWRDLELDARNSCLRKHAPLRVDLGGIAKGYAVDEAVHALKAAGVGDGWVNAGGDLRAFGTHVLPLVVRAPWDLAITIECGLLRNQAAATSASYLLASPQLKNGATQKLVSTDASFTVIANTCMAADALTKVAAAGVTACPALDLVTLQHNARLFSHRAIKTCADTQQDSWGAAGE